MKKFLCVLLVVAVVMTCFVGCGDGGESAKGLRVASLNAIVEGNPYRASYENQMTELSNSLKEKGIISEYNSYVANNDPALERQYLEQAINDGVDIIIMNPISASGLDDLIKKAVDAGITYVNADCEYPSKLITNVVVDQAKWAEIQADFVIATLGAGKKVIQFNGVDGNSASEIRSKVWKDKLSAAGIEIVKTVAHGWNDVTAKKLMSEIISSGIQFDGIINQESAGGILDAIEEAKIPYPACITSSEEVAWIRRIAKINADKVNFPFIVVENPPGIGATALSVAVNLAQGKEFKDGILKNNAIYYTPQWIMKADNMAQRVEEIKDQADSESVSSYLSVEDAAAAYFK